tara:strand:+ start:454 stop:981 length:528 start_codon:yes stop_codon:yes gene_type:complete
MIPYAALVAAGGFSLDASTTCHTYPGMMRCGIGEVEHISFVGQVSTMGTQVQKSTDVKGLFSANQSTFHDVDIHGKADMHQCQVGGDFNISGYLSSDRCHFGSISANSNRIKLTDTVVDSMQIRSDSTGPELHLIGKTEVRGNIDFLGYPGKIFCSKSSSIQGQVYGAEVIFINT